MKTTAYEQVKQTFKSNSYLCDLFHNTINLYNINEFIFFRFFQF